jgi:OmpA-OmpF porin, OOP family
VSRVLTFTLLTISLLCSVASTAHAQRGETYQSKVAAYDDSLVAVDAGLPLSDSADDRPTFTLDGETMIFGSERFSRDPWRTPNNYRSKRWDSDIWYRKLTDSGWSVPINLGPGVNDANSAINPTINPRGDMVYFIRNARLFQAKLVDNRFQEVREVNGELNRLYNNRTIAMLNYQNQVRTKILKEMEADSMLIELRQRVPDAWNLHYTERIQRQVNTWGEVEFWEGSIRCENTMSPDGRFAIFSENFGSDSGTAEGQYGFGGKGWGDLWLSTISPNGSWDTVKYLKGNINTEYNETYPFLAADGTTLYFSTNKPCATCAPGTSGGDDIYVTRLTDTGWTDPQPLGPPFNSPRGDYGFSIGPDGETAYFVSNRTGPSKLYKVKLRAQDSLIKPLPVFIVQGLVYDLLTNKPVKAQIFVDNLSEEETKFSVDSDSTSGQYVLAAQRGSRYGLQAVAEGYLPRSERVAIPKSGVFDRRKLDLGLAPIKVESSVELKNAYFEFGKSNLLPESKLELDRIVDFLKQKGKTIKVEIHGHTDEKGTDAFNLRLSRARAQSVLNYLASKGVSKSLMKAIGFGKSKPLDTAKTEEAQAKNRRVELVVKSL